MAKYSSIQQFPVRDCQARLLQAALWRKCRGLLEITLNPKEHHVQTWSTACWINLFIRQWLLLRLETEFDLL